ncbi:MAG: aspartate/glutamate racemase family protein [Bacteroidales bacterium]
MNNKENIIGIVGGVGPYAGTLLVEKIFNETKANCDQEHLPVALLSLPSRIVDRTEYLMGNERVNPSYAVHEIIKMLEQTGASVVGIPCNTMHADEIFETLRQEMEKSGSKVRLVNMIDEVTGFIQHYYPSLGKIGILSTSGTYHKGIYQETLKNNNLKPISPEPGMQESIHQSIYHPEYGIKSVSNPVSKKAKNILVHGIRDLKAKGAEGIILGCTEIAYALPYKELKNVPLFDTVNILARALIHNTYPEKLRNYLK